MFLRLIAYLGSLLLIRVPPGRKSNVPVANAESILSLQEHEQKYPLNQKYQLRLALDHPVREHSRKGI